MAGIGAEDKGLRVPPGRVEIDIMRASNMVEGIHIGLLLIVVNLGGGVGVPGREIMRHQAVALQTVHVKGHHASPLLHEALVRRLVGVQCASQHVIFKTHESVVWRVPISTVPWHG